MTDKITPCIDMAFKKIFGVEENKDLLISLINSIVGKEDQIVEATLLNPYNPKSFWEDKLSILDIKAKGHDGKRYNIEIQITDEADYDKRALYYWAKLYTEQLKKREDYSRLSKAIGIHILNFTSILNVDKYHNVFHITEKESGQPYFKDLELHTIELTKFLKNPVNVELADLAARIKNSLDIWGAFLTRHDLLNKEKLPKELDNPELIKALTVLEVMNFSSEEREAYEERFKWFMVEANTLRKYENKGFEAGVEKGKAEGREAGRAEGRAQGAIEKSKNIAKNLFAQDVSMSIVVKATGLSEAEVKALMEEEKETIF